MVFRWLRKRGRDRARSSARKTSQGKLLIIEQQLYCYWLISLQGNVRCLPAKHKKKPHYIEPQGTCVSSSIYPRFEINLIHLFALIVAERFTIASHCSIKPEVLNTEVLLYCRVQLVTICAIVKSKVAYFNVQLLHRQMAVTS